jgi:hypothetical protein
MVEPTMTDSPAKTADPCEAGTQVALESEVPVLQVAYDVVEGGGDSAEYSDASNRKYKWIAAFIVGLVTTTAALGLYAIFKSGGSGRGDDTRTRGKPSSSSPSLRIERTSMSSPPSGSPSSLLVNEFLSSLPQYSMELAESNNDSPQAKALAWLRGDPKFNEYENLYRLNQRYALAVLYYSTNAASSWNGYRGWISDENECLWYTSWIEHICTEVSRLTVLNLFTNALEGSLPTELELLTDLEYIVFDDAALSGTIHSEL